MKIYLTFDYELYFGYRTGTVEKCIIDPTARLTEVADRHGIKLCYFVDTGFLLKLRQQALKYDHLYGDIEKIDTQLKELSAAGHDLQLHIHPHWEDSYYEHDRWICKVDRYKLSDFPKDEAADIFARYHQALSEYTAAENLFAFRAGGWCIQPFQAFESLFRTHGIKVDSSVFAEGKYESSLYSYDFRGAPSKARWRFDTDPVKEVEHGRFTELPITSIYNAPLFYWRLFLLGRLFPSYHKPLGDGVPVPAPGQRLSLLTRRTYNTVSMDGYNASLLNRALRAQQRMNRSEMVIIGHPKALTLYGLNAMHKFITQHKHRHEFTTFVQQKNTFS